MVRITVDEGGAMLRLKLEGRLTGVFVRELEQCWLAHAARSPHKALVVDLTNTECVDLAGKYLLRLMHQSGARITARTPYMNALVEEIAGMHPAIAPRITDPPSAEGVKS